MSPEWAWLAGLVAGIGWGLVAGGALGAMFVIQALSSGGEK